VYQYGLFYESFIKANVHFYTMNKINLVEADYYLNNSYGQYKFNVKPWMFDKFVKCLLCNVNLLLSVVIVGLYPIFLAIGINKLMKRYLKISYSIKF